jgi:hypothetical protein
VKAPKYFHEVWPQRKTALVPPSRPARGNSMSSKSDKSTEKES